MESGQGGTITTTLKKALTHNCTQVVTCSKQQIIQGCIEVHDLLSLLLKYHFAYILIFNSLHST